MEITKIVITGGPCAGKTTALSRIHEEFTELGYTVLAVPETATEFITGGVAPWTCGTNAIFQYHNIKLQLEKEKSFTECAGTMASDKVLIVCDRGIMDNKAYMTAEEFDEVMDMLSLNEVELRDGYGAVFHLVTAADGAEEYYTTDNNSARTETPSAARALDNRLISAWTGHPHLRVIDNSTDFEGKIGRLIREIAFYLGEPEPLEIERKFLIEYPDTALLQSLPNCRKVEIVQTYLCLPDGTETRIRQRGERGNYVYFQTTKRKISDVKRVEVERRLTEDEYLELLGSAGPAKRQVVKDRYCLTYDGQYFEIDVYPFWNDRAIMELEMSDESAEIRFPPEVQVIREVTDDPAYRNSALAEEIVC